eukprot:746270-Hanusia_phi.AAC.5
MASSEDSDANDIATPPCAGEHASTARYQDPLVILESEEKVIKKTPRRRIRSPIVCLAFSSASAEALDMVVKDIGWQSRDVVYDKSDIFWVSTFDQLLTRLKCVSNKQICSRIPGMYMLCDKCPFSKVVCRPFDCF